VLGKYLEPQPGGVLYYVSDWTRPGVNSEVTKFTHILSAIAKIQQIAEETSS